jgi:hypothetical protein
VGGRLTWEPGQLSVTETLPEITLNPLSREKAIDAYLDLFTCAVRRRIIEGAPIRLPLSGGRDSRHILLELVALGAAPECCYTSPFLTGRNDAIVAQELCRRLNVLHAESDVPRDLVATDEQKNRRISYEAFEHGWTWALAQSMRDPEAVSYDGIDGDVLSAGHFHDDENSRLYRAGRFEQLAERLAPHPILRTAPAGLKGHPADAYQRIIRELLRYRDTQNPMMFFFLYNRSRRAVSITISGLFGSVLRAAFAPFLDRSVFDFLAGLPEEMFQDKMFHTQAISRKFPVADLVGYAKKTPVPDSQLLAYTQQGFRYALSAPGSCLFERPRVLARFIKALMAPGYRREALNVFHFAVLLNQIGRLADNHAQPPRSWP